jgi:hypothetical protein
MTGERLEVQRMIQAEPAGIFPVIAEGALRATLGILARTVVRGYIGRRT